MIRNLITLLAGALWLIGCSAPDPYAGHEWPNPAPALWQIEGPDGQIGWLFGTVHALPGGVEWRTQYVGTALAEADVLVVEIADLGNREGAGLFQQLGAAEDQLLIGERLSDADLPALAELLARIDAHESDFTNLDSWAAAITIASRARLADPANGVDRALIASGKPVIGLESYREQFEIFDNLPELEQRDLLSAVIRETSTNAQIDATDAWIAGDMDALLAISSTGIMADPELYEALVFSRNMAWSDRIAALMLEGKQPFVAVGAGHMLGRGGLPSMLGDRGYTVRRLQ